MNTPLAAEQALLRRQSVLDFVKEDVQSFRGRLRPEEATKMDFYLESLRALERQVGGTIPSGSVMSGCSALGAPLLSKDTLMNDMPEHSQIHLDIISMAFPATSRAWSR
jgi:hypothetical protein